jgi:hypothetical protein
MGRNVAGGIVPSGNLFTPAANFALVKGSARFALAGYGVDRNGGLVF